MLLIDIFHLLFIAVIAILIYGIVSILSETGYFKKTRIKIKMASKEHDFECNDIEITIQDENIDFINEGNKIVIFDKNHLEDD